MGSQAKYNFQFTGYNFLHEQLQLEIHGIQLHNGISATLVKAQVEMFLVCRWRARERAEQREAVMTLWNGVWGGTDEARSVKFAAHGITGAARVSSAANTRGISLASTSIHTREWVVAVLLVRVRVLVSKNLGTREYLPGYLTTCSSGGTVTKLCNQLSEQSAHSTVTVGQWASDPDLIAVDEFEKQLAEGWTRNKKRKTPATAEASGSARVIVIDDDST
ncbi:hypothetical protein FB45DRAFT_874785 [Roridomyces roridus]|uniref:Uncharacterized protein n=1 Tax=Roridomyces roridus TaxID=1738132 RepID=A0AAD7B7L0_9AGAR|nr:hypothetical protein FB45DRAFT_874785 [Roridomyces roridus]